MGLGAIWSIDLEADQTRHGAVHCDLKDTRVGGALADLGVRRRKSA
jgi:hypothetical protein